MYLLFDEALITRSSSSILFFKKHHETGLWDQYHNFDEMRGQIFFIRGNVRIQITTEEKIYFFLIDKETFIPKLENVMWNFMKCSQMMFGARVKYGISYKQNQPGFQIYTRKYYHNFKVCLNTDNYEGAFGANLSKSLKYILADRTKISICNQHDFKVVQQWEIECGCKHSHGDVQILYMVVSQDETKIAAAIGKLLIKE